MQLWKVRVVTSFQEDLVVLAESEASASDLAEAYREDALRDTVPTETTTVSSLSPTQSVSGWRTTDYVYNDLDQEITLGEAQDMVSAALREAAAHEEFLRRQIDMFK
jgi:hypothetical protein